MTSDDPSDKRTRKGKSNGTWKTILFTLFSIVAALVFNFLDDGPPLPPFPDTFTSIDCHSVTFESYNDRHGFLDFHFHVKPSVEYPPEYLPHFISIRIETPPTSMRYSGDEITNITRDSAHIRFSLVHTWAGPSKITSQCLHNEPQELDGNLSDIVNFVPQYSRSDFPAGDFAKFRDVCLEFEKFLYFVQVSGDRPAVPFDDEQLRFEMLKWPLDAYLKHKNVNMTHRTCFLVAPLSKMSWEAVLLTFIPLANSVARNTGMGEQPLFVFRKGVPEGAVRNLRMLSATEPVKLDDIMCFDTLLMTATYSRMQNREKRIQSALEADVGALRKRIPSVRDVDAKKIALSENLWDALEFRMKERFPEFNIVRVGLTDQIADIAAEVAPAGLLVGDHIASLVHMVWMAGGKVLDLTPDEFACNSWAEKFAKKIGLEYAKMPAKKSCNCEDWKCYPTKPTAPGVLEYDEIFTEIEKLVGNCSSTQPNP